MVRTSKLASAAPQISASTSVTPATVVAPPAATGSAAPEPTAKSSKRPRASKNTAATPVLPPVATPEVVSEGASHEEPVFATIADMNDSLTAMNDTLAAKLADLNLKIHQAVSFLNALKVQFKSVEKDMLRSLKASSKAASKKSKRSGNRQPSGFVRPTQISDELADFLGKNRGSEMARTEVSKEINKYIRSNNLQDKENGRQINADGKLTTLLKLKGGDVLTYFNLQRYMKHHFVKQGDLTGAPRTPVVVVA